MGLTSIYLAHAEPDHPFAQRLSAFLELGCNVHCSLDDGLISDGEDLIDKAEQGLACDVLVLLLSPASWPDPCPRERWEPVLFNAASESRVELASVMTTDCRFPALLRRRNFFDAAIDPDAALRQMKRWLWQRSQGASHSVNTAFSSDLADLYSALSDQAGTLRASAAEASRFIKEAGQEFEAVIQIPCHDRTAAQVAGELAVQLGLTLDGALEDNCRRIHELLFKRRCLLVLDAPAPEIAAEFIASGRTSTLVTLEPIQVIETPRTLAYARQLIHRRRYAEAYELLYSLLDSDTSTADCAHELSWICEHWNRAEESESLRFHYRLPPTEQLALF